MSENSLSEKDSFQSILDRFLREEYEFNSSEFAEWGSALHDKMSCIEDILPLLKSKKTSCQYLGVYIAALEGDRACRIFTSVYKLVDSPLPRIRDEILDCIQSCGNTDEEFEFVFSMLLDPEESIRVKVINILLSLNPCEASFIESKLISSSITRDFKLGFESFSARWAEAVDLQILIKNISSTNPLERVGAYVACYRGYGGGEELTKLLSRNSDSDIARHYQIYLTE